MFKKHVYESWRCLFEAFILKTGIYFCLDLHYVHKIQMGQRHTEKRSKNLFHPQMKFYNDFQKSVLVMAVFVPGFHIENRQLPFVRYTLCP